MGMFSKKKKGDGTSPIASRTNAQQLNPLNGPNGTAGPSSSPKIDIPKPPNPDLDPAGYLRSLQSVRERCSIVSAAAKHDSLLHFDVDYSLFKDTASFVVSIIKRDFAPNYSSVPSFGRWQQFNVGGRERIEDLLAEWGPEVDAQEKTRRLLDLFLISCLLDAGAASWQYRSKQSGKYYRRSEGLAVASLEMFKDGMFSSDTTQPCQVDGQGLRRMDMEVLSKGLQVSDSNQLPGIQGRTEILMRLANALNNQEVFGVDARPGTASSRLTPQAIANLEHRKYAGLSSVAPVDSGLCGTSRTHHHAVECAAGRPFTDLAGEQNDTRQHISRRRMALRRFTRPTPSAAVGEYCSTPQAYPMAGLFADHAHDEADEDQLRWSTTSHRVIGIPKRGPIHRYWTDDVEAG